MRLRLICAESDTAAIITKLAGSANRRISFFVGQHDMNADVGDACAE